MCNTDNHCNVFPPLSFLSNYFHLIPNKAEHKNQLVIHQIVPTVFGCQCKFVTNVTFVWKRKACCLSETFPSKLTLT